MTKYLTHKEALEIATHRHYKGGLYRMIGIATHSETGEDTVVYEHLYPHERKLLVRPKTVWDSPTEDGQVRFETLDQ